LWWWFKANVFQGVIRKIELNSMSCLQFFQNSDQWPFWILGGNYPPPEENNTNTYE